MMTLSDFVRVAVERLPHFTWFLGAGASQSANLPTAWDVMWNLKRRYYCAEENQRIAANDLQNAAVREKISQFLASRGFPDPGSPDEYGRCFDIVFGNDYERQQVHIAAMLSDDRVSLTTGHRTFAALLASEQIRCVFTTNFDNVVEKAVAEVAGRSLHAFHLEGSVAAVDALNADAFPLYCKLHGDFRYRSLKNLPEDLATQNAELSKALNIACNRFGMVVAGYSGRDESVMRLLNDVLEGQNPFPHGLYWLELRGRSPLPAVEHFLAAAKKKGIRAELVEIETFDSLMARIWRQLPDIDPVLAAKVGRTAETRVSIPVPAAGTEGPFVRLNGLPVQLQQTCLTLKLKDVPDAEALERIEANSGNSVSAVHGDGTIWAWGIEPSLHRAFGANLVVHAEVNISDRLADMGHNLFLKPLIERSIAIGLTRGKPLLARRSRDRMVLVVRDTFDGTGANELVKAIQAINGAPQLTGIVPNVMTIPDDRHPESEAVRWAEALEVELEEINGAFWILVKPQIWIWPPRSRRDAEEFLDLRRGKRFNSQTDLLLSAWIKLLLPSGKKNTEHIVAPFGDSGTVGAPKFTIVDRTVFSRRTAP